ncbi:flagellar biosynthetic protein FliR [Deferrisoma sp.]
MFGLTDARFFAFLLVLLRTASLFSFAPVFSSPFVPVQVKAAAALGLSVGLTGLGLAPAVEVPATTLGIAALAGREVVVGILAGFVARLVFAAVQFGGQLVGFQMGLGIVSVMDPQFETQISVVSQLEFILALLLFLSVGGDGMLIEAFAANLRAVPPGDWWTSAAVVQALVTLTGEVFRLGLALAAPVVAAIFASHVILGVFARAVPQMNMLILGFPLQILVGFTVLGLSLGPWGRAFLRALQDAFRALEALGRVWG